MYNNGFGQIVDFETLGNKLHIADFLTLLDDFYIDAHVLDSICKFYYVQSNKFRGRIFQREKLYECSVKTQIGK